MKIHVDNFLKLRDSLTVASDRIADTMSPIFDIGKGECLGRGECWNLMFS